jgi:hypothetical protein
MSANLSRYDSPITECGIGPPYLEMLNVLPDSHQFTSQTELLLNGLPGCNLTRCSICAKKVPGVELGEVLECSEELIATDGCRNELEVMGDGWMIDKRICDHLCEFLGLIEKKGSVWM